MKTAIGIASAFLFLLGLLAYAEKPDATEDQLIVASAKDVAKLHRVTEKPFKMDPAASLLCDAHASTKDLPSNPHEYFCHVFITESGHQAMKSGSGEYPAGTVIVKQKFADAKGKSTELYTLMRKMEPGYDPKHGDWEYSIVNRKATQVLARGRIESCVQCHKAYEKTDYVTRLYIPGPADPAPADIADPNSK